MSNTLQRLLAACLLAGALTTAVACASGEIRLPTVRRIVIYSGARLDPAQERLEVVDDWLREQWDSITLDPSFLINLVGHDGPVYPWEEFSINEPADTAVIAHHGAGLQGVVVSRAYSIYAHLHLMSRQNRLDRWLPEMVDGDAFELEKAILARVSDSWLYQRSVLASPPDAILDELLFVAEYGYLDAFVLTARPDEFVEARRAWLTENPDRGGEYVAWYRETFERDPPGFRGAPSGG